MSATPAGPGAGPALAFHLAFPVSDLAAARAFYGDLLGCPVGRTSASWVDFDFFGHQITGHLVSSGATGGDTNDVDGDRVPVRHFGAVLEWGVWEALARRFRAAGHPFRIEPRVRFQGEVGEQGTFFVEDPAGNALEFKTFRNPARLFASG